MRERTINILQISAVILACTALVIVIVPHTSASVFVYGSMQNYSAVVLPNNSYVHQGENISQGEWYDISGVCGWSLQWATWKNTDDIGYTSPTAIISPDNVRWVYIDPKIFPVGEYYQWDGSHCDDRNICSSGFEHGNAYVFAVVPKRLGTHNETVTTYKNITMTYENGTQELIQVTAQETVQVTDTIAGKQDVLASNIVTMEVPVHGMITAVETPRQTLLLPGSDHTPEPTTIPEVTVKSGIPVLLPLFALILIGVVLRRLMPLHCGIRRD